MLDTNEIGDAVVNGIRSEMERVVRDQLDSRINTVGETNHNLIGAMTGQDFLNVEGQFDYRAYIMLRGI